MKKIIIILFISTAFAVFQAPVSHSNSGQPPVYNAGEAAGQSSCNGGNCHNSNTIDSGNGEVTLLLANSETTYLPETIYNLTLDINHVGSKKFGFEMVAFDDDNNSVGTFFMNEEERIGIQLFDDIQFVHHKVAPSGEDAYTFNIEWESPAEIVGDIHFYACVNAANGVGSTGDFIYTVQLDISPKDDTAIEAIYPTDLIKIFPNPTSDFIYIENEFEKIKQVGLYDASGKIILDNISSNKIDLQKFGSGIYFIKLTIENDVFVKQIVKY